MKVFMLTQGEYSSYEVVALFTSQELAKGYALALATAERASSLKRVREDFERYERKGSSWDESTIKANWDTWVSMYSLERAESAAKEIRDSRRQTYLTYIKLYEKPVEMKEECPDCYGYFRIEEQELYDMVPVVKDDD